MPIYEYRCPKCGVDFELIRHMDKMNEPAECPQCGTEAERIFSASAYDHPKSWELYVPRSSWQKDRT